VPEVPSHLETARRVADIEISEIKRVISRLGSEFDEAVDLIRSAVENRGKIIVAGIGKSGHIGEKIAATLTSTGSPAVVLHAVNALHGDLGVVSDGDVVLTLSYSGETEELVNILPAFAQFDVRIVAMTGNPRSSLARGSHVILDVSIEREACPLELAPTSSTTAMLVVGDALAMALLQARGFTKDDFARFHPGGRLGRSLLLRVRDVMRPADAMAAIAPTTSVLDAVKAMTRHRAGAAVILDDGGRLAGIFTHGDFARHYQDRPDLGTRPVSEFMTAQPVTIRSDRLATEVLHVLQQHRIDDLVVLDDQHRPVGIVDSQDLSRMKIL